MAMLTNTKFVERRYHFTSVMMKGEDATAFLPLGYSSLLGECLRLVSYATGTLPDLRLRAFHCRSSLPSLCYRLAGGSVAAHETPAANDYGRGDGVKRSRLLDLLSLTKRR
jgi:hypothetical protein